MERGRKAYLRHLALDVRKELGLGATEPLDPRELALLYGYPVIPLSQSGAEPGMLVRLAALNTKWSGATISDGNRAIILENDCHSPGRRNATIAHEVAHILLEHQLQPTLMYERSCGAGKDLEEEASELSGELLIPRDAAVQATLSGMTVEAIAETFQVSVPFAHWRVNVTGANKIKERTRSGRHW